MLTSVGSSGAPSSGTSQRVDFLGVGFDPISMDELVAELSAAKPEERFRYVVTPNVDHVVRLDAVKQTEPSWFTPYDKADFVVCDSRILLALAKLCGVRLTLAAGSDLTRRLFDDVLRPGDRIAIVGGDEDTIPELRSYRSTVEYLQHIPPMGMLQKQDAMLAACTFVLESRARFTFLAVGSPQQELLAAMIAKYPSATGIGLCIGAGLDFIVGRDKRAPVILQKMGLEWLHRLSRNPKRLWRRYLVTGPRIFAMTLRWRRTARKGAAAQG